MKDMILYSALYGDYDEVPWVGGVDIPTVLYTDNQDTAIKAVVRGWNEARLINHGIVTLNGDPKLTGPMLAHKYWKCFAGFDEAEITVWLDASMTITRPEGFRLRMAELLGDVDMALMAHPWRGCLYDEATFSASLPRYASLASQIQDQANYYRSIGIPDGLGLYASGCFIRDNETTHGLMKDWWWEIITRTHQDQISLPVVLSLHPEITYDVRIPWHDSPESWTHLGFHLK